MATKTVNRQTYSLDYDLDDLNQGMFSMTEFKGICDRENDVTVDQNTFSKAENIYIDDNNVLASRAPFKFNDGYIEIVDEWHFGNYGLRLQKHFSPAGESAFTNYDAYQFVLYCFTHNSNKVYYEYSTEGRDDITIDVPKITMVQIEDKIFIWFAGQRIVVFNTAGNSSGEPFFEDAYKYLYIPAHTLVTNGFESELEAKNFLTDSYIKRYLYTTESQIDWKSLVGKRISVYKTDEDGSRIHLYDDIIQLDTNIAQSSDYELIYPIRKLFTNTEILIKEYNGIPIIIQYTKEGDVVGNYKQSEGHRTYSFTDTLKLRNFQVAYNTGIFRTIPMPEIEEDIKSLSLSDDGSCLFARTKHYLLSCALFVTTSDDTQLSYDFVWENQLLLTTLPFDAEHGVFKDVFVSHFHNKDNYAYFYQCTYNTVQNIAYFVYCVNGQRTEFSTQQIPYDPYTPSDTINSVDYEITMTINPYRGLQFVIVDDNSAIISLSYYTLTDYTNRVFNGINKTYYIPLQKSAYTSHDEYIFLSQNTEGTVGNDSIKAVKPVTIVDENSNIITKVYDDTGFYVFVSKLVEGESFSVFVNCVANWQSTLIFPTDFWTQNELKVSITDDTVTSDTEEMTKANVIYLAQSEHLLLTRDGLLTSSYLYKGNYENFNSENRIIFPDAVYSTDSDYISYDVYGLFGDTVYLGRDDEIWTNQLQSGTIVEVDTYENVTFDDNDNMTINFRPDVPDCFAALGDYYISFTTNDGQFRLLMSDTRRDEDTNDFLLYLPEDSEQRFSQRITNLHPLADDTMGIFTESEIWYIKAVNLDNESVTRYTKAIRSKLPVGCRQGNDVITADNGQAILFAVPRGIAYLTPQDFVSTTDRQINYISDAIQNMYNSYYFDVVKNSNAHEYGITIPSQIKIMTFSYWICFYRYFDNQILLIDTRSNSWWKWTTPYPIIKLNNDGNLTVIMQIEKSKYAEDYLSSLGGVSYLYCDLSYYLYQDDVLDDYIDGTYIVQTSAYGERIEYQYASPIIDWSFTTQKLHFGAINNYKYVRAININTNGEGRLIAKYTTKAYRDLYHPEASVTREIKINDLRTYVNRCNLLHVVNFALSLSSEEVSMVEPLSLNSISIKYEIKGQVR